MPTTGLHELQIETKKHKAKFFSRPPLDKRGGFSYNGGMARPVTIDYSKYPKSLMKSLYIEQNLSRKEVGARLGISSDQTKHILKHLGIVKSPELRRQCQRKGIERKSATGWYKQATTKSWQDSEIRARRLEGQKKSRTPEWHKHMSQAQKGKCQPESQKQKMRELWQAGRWDFFKTDEFWGNRRGKYSQRTKEQLANLSPESALKFFGKSADEDEFHKQLIQIFPNTKRQYRSEQYPYYCDFYIPERDEYVELSLHWTHGGKPYEGTKEDKQKVTLWQQRGSRYYLHAIHVWTERDIEKRQTAKKNGVNLTELFTENECESYLQSLKSTMV